MISNHTGLWIVIRSGSVLLFGVCIRDDGGWVCVVGRRGGGVVWVGVRWQLVLVRTAAGPDPLLRWLHSS